MKLSDNLKRIRKENNLSQEQLAEKLGVSRQAVSKWESEQSYPEMDKVLLICKLFNYNIDELMNENVKEVDENKESKNNFNKYVEDFFAFITKTVDMLSSMTMKQRMKCLAEQCIVGISLAAIFAIIGGMVYQALSLEQIIVEVGLGKTIISIVKTICSLYNIFALIVGIKFMIAFVAIGFVFTFISLVALLVLSFLFVKTGLVFAGTVMGIVAGILINFVVLEVLYNFIISKKSKKNKIAIILIISLVLAGLGLGTFWFGMTEFNYINTIENAEKTVFDVQMSDKLSINYWNNIEYIETDSENIKIEVIHPKYLDVYISKENEIIDVKYITKNEDIIQQIRDIINDINNKEIRNYIPTVYVYTSKGNIEKLIANRKKAYETQQREIGDLKETIQKKEQEIENLKQEILDLKTRQ